MNTRTKFYGQEETLSDPGDQAVPVLADGNDFEQGPCKYLRVGTGGTLLKMKGPGDDDWVPWVNPQSGEYVPFRAQAIHEDTDAADILAIY